MNFRRPLGSVFALALAFGLTGCPEQPAANEEHYPLQAESQAIVDKAIKDCKDAKSRADTEKVPSQIEAGLAQYYGSPENPQMPGYKPATPNLTSALPPLQLGRKLYKQHCMHCHGYYGQGDGPTANFLLPKPRNFLFGEFKFTSTKAGSKPTHDDLKRTIAQGIQGTMMPAFGPSVLTDDLKALGFANGFAGPAGFDVDAVAWYVQLLAMRGEVERKLVAGPFNDNGAITPDDVVALEGSVEASWTDAANQALAPEGSRPDRSPEALAKSVKAGDELFHTQAAQCVVCHGATGLGDGLDPNAPGTAKDVWGTPLRPANLTLGVYRGGRRPIDLYRRIHVGIKGNVMPGFGAQLKPEQVWNLVDYVQSLGLREEKP